MKILKIAGGIFLLLILGAMMGVGASPSLTAGVDLEKAQELLEQSQAEGYITSFTCIGNEAEVTSHFWAGLTGKGKKGLALSLAAICNSQQSGDRITILDSQSGKTLASFFGGTYRVE